MELHLYKNNAIQYDILTDKDEIVGGVLVVDYIEYLEINNLFINEDFQGNKYGRWLINTVLETYPNKTLCLQCKPFNNGLTENQLKDWYTRLGFLPGSPYHKGENWMHLVREEVIKEVQVI